MGASSGYGHVDHWSRRAVDDQIILGHLLPRYQAAQDWQAIVRTASTPRIAGQRVDREMASARQRCLNALSQAVRRWGHQSLAHGAQPIRLEPRGGVCRR